MTESHHRMPSESTTENSIYVAQMFGIQKSLASRVLMDTAFKMPGDSHYWINMQRSIRFINGNRILGEASLLNTIG